MQIFLGDLSACTVRTFYDCPISGIFYDYITKAHNIPRDIVTQVIVVLNWRSKKDAGRRIIVASDDEDGFKLLVRFVREADIWKLENGQESGDCTLNVYIK